MRRPSEAFSRAICRLVGHRLVMATLNGHSAFTGLWALRNTTDHIYCLRCGVTIR